jgi:hypothetical protein
VYDFGTPRRWDGRIIEHDLGQIGETAIASFKSSCIRKLLYPASHSASVDALLAAFPPGPGPWLPPLLGTASTGNTAGKAYRWSRSSLQLSHLGKAGRVELTKWRHFRITDQGREVLAASPERIDISTRFPGHQQFRGPTKTTKSTSAPSASSTETAQALTPDEVMQSANHQLEIALANDELIQ